MSDFGSKKILVVDDMKVIRNIIKKFLIKFGVPSENITDAADGKEAVKIIETNNFDIIISDWNMPEMSGLELLKYCKAEPATKNIPFMLLTSEAEKSQVIEALKAGVNLYLVKPVNEDALYEKLLSII